VEEEKHFGAPAPDPLHHRERLDHALVGQRVDPFDRDLSRTTRAELDATFAALTDRATWPLVALPGDLEPVSDQVEAIAAARRRGTAVIDGRLVQRIELPAATIALVPGVSAASRLAAGADGCRYRAEDAAAAFADLTPRAGLRILASVEAPRPPGPGEPTGELAITAGAGQQIDIALHGPSSGTTDDTATPARSGNRDGAAVSVHEASNLAVSPLRFEVAGAEYKDRLPHADESHHASRVSRKAVRRRGDRRIRQDHAADPARKVAHRRRPPRVRHGMELVGARQGGDENREKEKRAHADDVQPAARHRLR
jgi:hypothetical protein